MDLYTATNYLVEGCFDEDFGPKEESIGGYRSVNHFYDPLDPTYGKGLSDSIGFSISIGDKRELVGTNSFAWASISNCAGIVKFGLHPTNIWSWPNARGYEWIGLTATNKGDRIAALTNMFRSVGQVMHLLEDASQPQHVRNEQHLDRFPHTTIETPWISPIEEYGKSNYLTLNYKHGMLSWAADGFTKLEDFWDRHLYNGNSSALDNAEANGGVQLGLAEWCNGNFLGARHTYGELFSKSSIKYYPFPSFKNTTQPQLTRYSFSSAVIDPVTLRNHKSGDRVYISKTGAGVHVTHHSALTYLGVQNPPRLANSQMRIGLTIDDTNVLHDYHDLLIPKAVEYSAGLLDYFFRGTFTVTLSSSTNLTVLNTSGQDFTGGAFFLFQEDTNGIRTPLQSYPVTGILPGGSISNLIYSGSIPSDTKFFLVYQGTIGVTSGTTDALDPVDAGIGIAVAVSSNTVWQSSFEGNGETNYLAEEGDNFAEGWHVDSADVNVQVSSAAYKGTHFININGDSGQPGVISTNIVTVPGLMYRLNFAYSENPDGRDYGEAPTGVVQAIENDNLLLALTVDKPDNTWDNLEWSQASATFTADSSVTQIQFASQTANVYGVLLDAVSLEALSIGP